MKSVKAYFAPPGTVPGTPRSQWNYGKKPTVSMSSSAARKKAAAATLAGQQRTTAANAARTKATQQATIGPQANTYDAATGVYTDAEGNQSSVGAAPPGAQLINETQAAEDKFRDEEGGQEERMTEEQSESRPAGDSESPDPYAQFRNSKTGIYDYSFLTVEGQKERINNMYDVMKIAANPFNDERIQSNTNVDLLDKGLEAVANNPYKTAAVIAGVVTAVSSAYTVVTKLGGVGKTAAVGKGIVMKGITALKTRTITSMVVDAATAINANKAWVLAGLGLFSMGVGVKFLDARSQSQVFNDGGDVVQGLSIAAGNLRKSGMIDEAEEIETLIYEAEELTDKLANEEDGIFKNIKDVFVAGADKISKLAESTRIQAEAAKKKAAQDDVNAEIKTRIDAGTATPEEMAAYIEANPYSDIARNYDPTGDALLDRVRGTGEPTPAPVPEPEPTPDVGEAGEAGMSDEQLLSDPEVKRFAENPNNWNHPVTKAYEAALERQKDEINAEIDNAINTKDEELMRRKLDMTDEEYINDQEVMAFIQDSKNSFSGTIKLYDQAFARVAGQSGGSASNYTTQGPSTLGFGLLRTGSESKKTETPEIDDKIVSGEPQSLDDKSQEIFGVPYAQLNDAQKALLNK